MFDVLANFFYTSIYISAIEDFLINVLFNVKVFVPVKLAVAEKFWGIFNCVGGLLDLSYFYNNLLALPRDNRPFLAFYKEFKSVVKVYFLSRL